MQRKDGGGRKEGWKEGRTTPRGEKERQKRWVSRGLRNGEREQGRRRKRAPSIPYLCYLKPFECTWLGDINAKLCCARITDLIRDDRAKEGDRRRDPDMWLVRFQTSELLPTSLIFQGSKKKKKKESHVRWKTTESVESVSARSSSLTKEMWLKKDQAAVRVDLMWYNWVNCFYQLCGGKTKMYTGLKKKKPGTELKVSNTT